MHTFLRGVRVGAVTGTVLAAAYSGLILGGLAFAMLVGALLGGASEGPAALLGMAGGAGLMLLIGGIFAFFLGIVPGTAVGALTGALIGLLHGRRTGPIAVLPAVVLGVAVALPIAILLNVTVGRTFLDDESDYFTYLLWIGVPTLIYLLGSGWMGWRLRQPQEM